MRATKSEWIYDLVDETGFTQKDCKAFVDGFIRVIQMYLEHGDDFYLTNFGTFELKEKAASKVPVRNGGMKGYPSHTRVHFVPAKRLKEAVYNVKPNNDV